MRDTQKPSNAARTTPANARLISATSKWCWVGVKILRVDGDHEAQRRALILGRELAHQGLERMLVARQMQIALAGVPVGKGTDLWVGVAVFVGWVAAHYPEVDTFVLFTEQL